MNAKIPQLPFTQYTSKRYTVNGAQERMLAIHNQNLKIKELQIQFSGYPGCNHHNNITYNRIKIYKNTLIKTRSEKINLLSHKNNQTPTKLNSPSQEKISSERTSTSSNFRKLFLKDKILLFHQGFQLPLSNKLKMTVTQHKHLQITEK